MDVDSLMISPGPDIYYDDGMRRVFEDHMTFLRTHSSTQKIMVDPMAVYQYEFDFYGLLTQYNFPAQYHFIIMRMNNISAPTDFPSDLSSLLIPDKNIIGHIVQSYTTTSKLN